MKPHRIILAVIVIVGLIAFFTPSFAKQAPKKSSDQTKGTKSKTPTVSTKKAKIQPLNMELFEKNDKLYLKLPISAKSVWVDQRKKGVKSIGKGKLIEVTPYLSKAKAGKLTFVVLGASGKLHTKKLPVSKYLSLLKTDKTKSDEKKKSSRSKKKGPTNLDLSQDQKPSIKKRSTVSSAAAEKGLVGLKIKRVFSKDGSLHVTIVRTGSGPITSKSIKDIKLKIDSQELKLNKSLALLMPHWKTAGAKKRELDIDTGLHIKKREWVTATLSDARSRISSKKFLLPAVKDLDVKKNSITIENLKAKGKQLLDSHKKNISQHGTMSAERPKLMGTTAGRMDTTQENRIVGHASTNTGSIREMAKESQKLKPVSEYARAQAPQLPEEPLDIEQTLVGIIIEAPEAGSQVRAGNSVRIRWEYEESVFERYRDRPMSVDLYARSVENPSNIVWAFTAGSDREVDWHIPSDTLPGLYGIMARFDSGMTVYNGSTHIEVLPSSDLILVWPPPINPGETTLYVGYDYPITWNAYGDAVDQPLNIDLMSSSGSLVKTIASGINPPSERYSWLVGGNCNTSAIVPRGDNYRIRISTTDDPAFEAQSAPINIRLPTIDVVSPNTLALWRIGDSYNILWDSDHVPEDATVKLSLLKGGNYYQLIDENQPSIGSYTWEEAGIEPYIGPVTNASTARRVAQVSNDYSIRIEMEDCDLVYGISPVFHLTN